MTIAKKLNISTSLSYPNTHNLGLSESAVSQLYPVFTLPDGVAYYQYLVDAV